MFLGRNASDVHPSRLLTNARRRTGWRAVFNRSLYGGVERTIFLSLRDRTVRGPVVNSSAPDRGARKTRLSVGGSVRETRGYVKGKFVINLSVRVSFFCVSLTPRSLPAKRLACETEGFFATQTISLGIAGMCGIEERNHPIFIETGARPDEARQTRSRLELVHV